MSSLSTPKPPLMIAGRKLRRRLITTDANVTSGVTAAPSTWDEPRHRSPALFDDTTHILVPNTQEIALSQPIVATPSESSVTPRSVISESQQVTDSSFTFYDSQRSSALPLPEDTPLNNVTTVPETQATPASASSSPSSASSSGTPALFPQGSEHSMSNASLLVTSSMLPHESPSANHARTVSDLILANQRIASLLKQIEELKANNIATAALRSLPQPAVQVPRMTVAPTAVPVAKPEREMLLFRASGRFTVLSNFFECRLSISGVLFRSAEHAYQHKKAIFHGRNDLASRVLRSRTPHMAKQIVKPIIQCSAWHDCKTDIMSQILEEKAKQCHVFRKALENTGDRRLVHNTETDSFWGCGEDFHGLNTLGCLLEDLRLRLSTVLPKPIQNRSAPTVSHQSVLPTPVAPQHLPRPSPATSRTSVNRPKVLVLGNSNARGVAQGLIDRGLDACGYTLPGGTISHVTSRLQHVKCTTDFLLLMAGDIEAADGLSADSICARYEHMLKEARHRFPWTRIILSGLPQAGSNYRQDAICRVNSYLEKIAHEERLIEYVSNAQAKLRDNIHLCRSSKERLCLGVSNIVKKVFM